MSEQDLVVTARPIITSRIAYAGAVFVIVVFVGVSLVMKRDNAGATFGYKDQIATVVVGLILAGIAITPTRPRLYADLEAVRMRSYLGGWRTVPWDLIVRVEFPRKVRFARIVLPGEEILALYAVQRLDARESVVTMGKLRELFAATHPGTVPPAR
jgi:hypothetical protein